MTAVVSVSSAPGAASAYAGAAPSAASMRAQLQRFQKVLNECVNCASARTTQGKADIHATELRISQLEERIAAQEKAGSAVAESTRSATPPASAGARYGGAIDVFA